VEFVPWDVVKWHRAVNTCVTASIAFAMMKSERSHHTGSRWAATQTGTNITTIKRSRTCQPLGHGISHRESAVRTKSRPLTGDPFDPKRTADRTVTQW
jgi:hypothetical protein